MPEVTLAALVKRWRENAELTQEELAEASGLTVRTVSDLERGISKRPHKPTIQQLADALGLTGAVREEFEAVARGRDVAGAMQTLPRDIISFTGREDELRQLIESAASSGGVVGIHAIGGMAGVGKTTFAVHAAYELTPQFPDGQIYLELHGHTPGRSPVDPADALARLLLMAGITAEQIPADLDERVAKWRNRLAGWKLLLILDGALDSKQVEPLLPGAAECLVLVTSRRRLTALPDASVISLDVLAPDEAAMLLVRIAARADLDSGDKAVSEIVRLCGALPLAVTIMAAQLRDNKRWTLASMAVRLREAQDRLKPMVAEHRSVAAAFDLSYQNLTEGQQRLFRRLALHPGDDLDSYAVAALDDSDLEDARQTLADLCENYLLIEPEEGRYRFHDLIRQYARTLGETDPPVDREAAMARLLDYYLHTVRHADRYLARRVPRASGRPLGAAPRHAPDFSERADAVRWMDDERLNLQAVTEYADQNAQRGYAIAIPAAMRAYLRSQGHWNQALDLYRTAREAARQSGDGLSEADALAEMGPILRMTGDYPAAAHTLTLAFEQYDALGDRLGQASALHDLGAVQAQTGNLSAAVGSLDRCLDLFRGLGDQKGQAGALNYLGVVQRFAGDYQAAAANQAEAIELCRALGDEFGEASALNDLGAVQRLTGDYRAAAFSQARALDLFRRVDHRLGQASALNDLGVIRTLTKDYPEAISNLQDALKLFSDLVHLQGKANALTDLGAVQALTGDYPAATTSFGQAREIYTSLGHRQGEAELLNNMGETELASSETQQAYSHHQEALAIAADIKVPAEQARALEGIGRCQLLTGQAAEGAASLQQALEIYQRINSPYADRVAETLGEQRP